jgi:hypothetical protein
MSAYALPGLFPPLPVEYSNHSICASGSYTDTALQKVDYHSDSVVTLRECNLMACSEPSREIAVTVTNTKVDVLQLIHSLTTSTYGIGPNTTTTCLQQSKKRGRRRMSPTSSSEDIGSTAATVCSSETLFPQEQAMQFELLVSHHGRQYTLTRSLHRIRQLRQELLVEQSYQESADHDAFGRTMEATKTTRTMIHTTTRRTTTTCSNTGTSIPDLPSLPDHGAFSNQSFSSLHALLRSYAPAVQDWFKVVVSPSSSSSGRTRHPSDSLALTNFLLEPLCSWSSQPLQLASSDSDRCVTTTAVSMLAQPDNVGSRSQGGSGGASSSAKPSRHFGRHSSLESIEELLEEHLLEDQQLLDDDLLVPTA